MQVKAPSTVARAPGQRGICDFMADTPVRRTAAAATSVGFPATQSIAVFWTNRRRCDPVHMAVAIIRHVNNKQDAAWCHDHGYANYATKDGFCVGAGGKLIKVGSLAPRGVLSPRLVRGRPQTANRVPVLETRLD